MIMVEMAQKEAAAVGVPRAFVLACFLSNFDRFAITPMLLVIAAGLQVPLASVVLTASGYFFAYGLAQPVWGMLSDRYGRMRVIRLTLALTAVCGALSAFAPNVGTLVVLRVATGAFFGAIVPTSLTYVGDTVPVQTRQRALSDLQLALAIGTALATVVAGGIAQLISWRVMFALPAVLAAVLVVWLRNMPEPAKSQAVRGPAQQLATVFKQRWSWLVMALGLVEGAVLLGCFTFLAPALEHEGLTSIGAGTVTALYGVGTLVFSRVLKRVALRAAWQLLVAGGIMVTVGFAACAISQSVVGIGIAAVLLGGGWAFMHSSLQTWATTLAPAARGTAVSLFVAALFVGSAIGSALGGPLADSGSYGPLFALAALVAVPLTVVGGLARRRYVPPQG
jgi:predicted MFS family arabinose efflux permease